MGTILLVLFVVALVGVIAYGQSNRTDVAELPVLYPIPDVRRATDEEVANPDDVKWQGTSREWVLVEPEPLVESTPEVEAAPQ